VNREGLAMILDEHPPNGGTDYPGRCAICHYVRSPCLIASLACDLLLVLDILEKAEAREDAVDTEDLRRAFDAS
jgi:hypothetical protein